MRRTATWLAVMLLSLGAAFPHTALAQLRLVELPADRLDLGRRDRTAIERGRVVAKTVKVNTDREIAALGIVRIDVPPDFLIERFRDVEAFFAEIEIVKQIGTFGETPGLTDLHGLTIPEQDIEDLRSCDVGNCSVKLPARAIEQIRSASASSQPDGTSEVAAFIAAELVDYLSSYTRMGDAGLPEYNDKPAPLNAAAGFQVLRQNARWLLEREASLREHLREYPQSRTDGAEDILFWMVEDVGVRPIISLNHMTIVQRPGASDTLPAIAIKQLYATHYLQAGIKIASLAPVAEQDPQSGVYLVFYWHLLFDAELAGIQRLLVERRLKSTWAAILDTIRRTAEENYQLAPIAVQ